MSKTFRTQLKKFVLSGLGTGYLPIAPGTWGSGAVAVVFVAVAWASAGRWYCTSGTMLLLAAAAAVACVALGRFCENAWGQKDPKCCTIDEWSGQALTYLLLPLGDARRHWLMVAVVGFIAFRLLDIIKPSPARRLERLPLGWGVLVDDLVAAVYANLACQLLLRLWLLKAT